MSDVTIKLSKRWQEFIAERIVAGRLESIQDAIEVGLKFLEADEAKHDALVLALKEGEESGPATPFDMDEWLAEQRDADGRREAA